MSDENEFHDTLMLAYAAVAALIAVGLWMLYEVTR